MDLVFLLRQGTIATCICEHLPFISRLSLKKAYPRIKTLGHVFNFRNIIVQKLNNIGLDGKKIHDVLRTTPNTWLSGSFLLKCLNGDSWHAHDMDIYSKEKDKVDPPHYVNFNQNKKAFTHRLLDAKVIQYEPTVDNPGFDLDPDAFMTQPSETEQKMPSMVRDLEGYDIFNNTIDILTFDVTNFDCIGADFVIQDIEIYGKTTLKDMIDNFDMEFLKNTYDGHKLYISSPEAILKKECNVVFTLSYFKYIFTTSILDEMGRRYIKIRDRLQKYVERGFKLKIIESDELRKIVYDPEKLNNFIHSYTSMSMPRKDNLRELWSSFVSSCKKITHIELSAE
jgi:hypothetical protein